MSNTAYDRGYQAYLDGEDLESNPYQSGGAEFDAWESGWSDAMTAENPF